MEKAEKLYYNGIIYPVDDSNETYEAIATKGERILALGTLSELKAVVGANTEKIDLKGQMLLPGFIDSHAHFLDTGMTEIRIDFGDTDSIETLLKTVSERTKQIGTNEWVLGGNFDENFTAEKRLPTIEELDEASNGHPLYINHRSYHWSLVNTAAFGILQLDPDTKGIVRDDDGNFTGLLNYDANELTKEKMAELVTEEDLYAGFQAVSKKAAAVGLTTIHCIEGGSEYGGDKHPDFLLNREWETLEPVIFFNTEEISKIKERNLPRQGGDIMADGSVSNRTAAFFEPYTDDPNTSGTLYQSQEKLRELIKTAHLNNVQISFHAIGDRGIEEILNAYEYVLKKYPKEDHRHRIEHFGFATPEQITLAKELGIAIAFQPAFTYQKGSTYTARLGKERFQRSYPLRDLLDAGLLVGGGSDSMVSPLDPIFGIHTAVNCPNEGQRITVEEAIRLYTISSAALAFQEKEKGSLEVGKLADFAVLEKDLREVEPSEIENIKVTMTVFRGKTVYQQ